MRFATLQRVKCITEVTPADFNAHLEEVMTELSKLEKAGVNDIDVGANLATRRVDVSMWVEAADQAEAVWRSLATLRAALHAVGAATHGWDTAGAEVEVRPDELVEA